MNKALRKAIVAGNWKMNNDRKAAKELIGELTPMVKDAACEVVLCVPYTNLETALSLCEGTNLHVGAENCHWAKSGAFTGEISAQMLAEMGVEYVIIGHSERRQYFGETDQTVNARVRAALDAGLKVILCVGEVLEQRELGVTEEVKSMQTKIALGGVSEQELANIVIAYEPVWAIGTGKTATAEQAQEVCAIIRGVVAKLYNKAAADALTIQYTVSAVALNNALNAQVDVISGDFAPTGKLSLTMVSDPAVIAITEQEIDGVVREICASPNDVPGYDKDQYIAPEVLAQSPSGSYAYQDEDGNTYKVWFGLTY